MEKTGSVLRRSPQSHRDNVETLMRNTSWTEAECEKFIAMVTGYLDSCGYFMGDFNIHSLPVPEDRQPYATKGICRWLLDMALQLNMENGFEYKVELVDARRSDEIRNSVDYSRDNNQPGNISVLFYRPGEKTVKDE